MTRKRPEISRTGGLVCTDDVLHAWCEAKETKEIVCSTIPAQYRSVLYLPTRGGGIREGDETTAYGAQLLVLGSILYDLSMSCRAPLVCG